jgi:ribonuclease HI
MNKNKNVWEQIWKMYFDGSSSKGGSSVRVVLGSPSNETISLSYKLEFKKTNNITEYEELILGLRATTNLKIYGIHVFGDSVLIIQ